MNLSAIVTEELPTLVFNTVTLFVRTEKNFIKKCQRKLIKAESSEKISRTFKHNVQTCAEVEFIAGLLQV